MLEWLPHFTVSMEQCTRPEELESCVLTHGTQQVARPHMVRTVRKRALETYANCKEDAAHSSRKRSRVAPHIAKDRHEPVSEAAAEANGSASTSPAAEGNSGCSAADPARAEAIYQALKRLHRTYLPLSKERAAQRAVDALHVTDAERETFYRQRLLAERRVKTGMNGLMSRAHFKALSIAGELGRESLKASGRPERREVCVHVRDCLPDGCGVARVIVAVAHFDEQRARGWGQFAIVGAVAASVEVMGVQRHPAMIEAVAWETDGWRHPLRQSYFEDYEGCVFDDMRTYSKEPLLLEDGGVAKGD